MQTKRSSETAARIVAASLMAASPIAAAFPVSAQQVASSGYSIKDDPAFKHCEEIKDIAQSTACYVNTDRALVQARIKSADARIKAADASIARSEQMLKCIAFLKGKKAEGVKLAPERLTREKGCEYAVELGMK